MYGASNPEKFSPRAWGSARIKLTFAHLKSAFRVGDSIRRHERFTRGKLRLQRFGRRHTGGLHECFGLGDRFVVGATANRQFHTKHLQRPLVPPHRLCAVRAIRLAGLSEVVAGTLVRAAHEVDLRQRVEDRAGRLFELHRAADV